MTRWIRFHRAYCGSLKVQACSLALFALLAAPLSQAGPLLLRISTENTPNHVQTRAVQRFVEQLEALGPDLFRVEYSHSARLFRDRDVIAALATGKVDMAIPGMWQLDRFVPDVGIYMLPLFYGRDLAQHHRIRDGEVGQEVSRRIQRDLDVQIPGRWLDLGYAHLYFTAHPVARHEDLAGLRIRIPGGVQNRDRLTSFDAEPVQIAWPDLSIALQQGRLDGVLTTHETVRSGELWQYGVSHAFEDGEYFAQYVPLIAGDYWRRLAPAQRDLLRQAWEQIVDVARQEAAQAQAQARALLQAQGISLVQPSPAALEYWRTRARQHEPATLQETGIDPRLVRQAEAELDRP